VPHQKCAEGDGINGVCLDVEAFQVRKHQMRNEAPGSSPKGNSEVRGFQAKILRFFTPDLGDSRANFRKSTPS
jgi:hypothetical protein